MRWLDDEEGGLRSKIARDGRNGGMKTVCVFCGSNFGRDGVYEAAAAQVGRELAERGLRIVYGGASVGLMGALADAALAAGGEVVGVIPGALVAREIAHSALSELHHVGSMHERKQRMADLSDAFIALPGGAGTLEELFEIWTWAQLGHHAKPVGLLNVAGFFDSLIAFLDHQAGEGFMQPEHRRMLTVRDDLSDLLDEFESYSAPKVDKWIRREAQT